MFKIMLAITVFSIFSYIGFVYGEKFRKRVLDLKECYKGITLLQNQVIYNNTPLPEAFLEVEKNLKKPYSEILLKSSFDLTNCNKDNIIDAFKDASSHYMDNIHLKEEDLKVLIDFLSSLGDTGIYCQDKIFNIALENMKNNLKEAEESSSTNTKLYRYLGICFGAMVGILII